MREIKSIEAQYTEGGELIVVSRNGVSKIEEHMPRGEGDRLYYDVHFDNGEMSRMFNVSVANFYKIEIL